MKAESLSDILLVADSRALTRPLHAPALAWKPCACSLKEDQLLDTCCLCDREEEEISCIITVFFLNEVHWIVGVL